MWSLFFKRGNSPKILLLFTTSIVDVVGAVGGSDSNHSTYCISVFLLQTANLKFKISHFPFKSFKRTTLSIVFFVKKGKSKNETPTVSFPLEAE